MKWSVRLRFENNQTHELRIKHVSPSLLTPHMVQRPDRSS